MSLSRQVGVLTSLATLQGRHGGSPFGSGRASVVISAATVKNDPSSPTVRADGCGPFGAWHPQIVDGGLAVEVPEFPGGPVYDLVLDANVSETANRIACFVRPMEWGACTYAQAPQAGWTNEATNGAPVTVRYPDGRASWNSFIEWPVALWIPDSIHAAYQATTESEASSAQTLFGPLRQSASTIPSGLAAALGRTAYANPSSGVYSDASDNNFVQAQEHAAVWLSRLPANPSIIRRCWDPFWPMLLGANFPQARSYASSVFEGAPIAGYGSSDGTGRYGNRGRFWSWRISEAIGFAPSYPASAADWLGSFWDPTPGNINYATHDPPGRAMTWGVPEDGYVYFHTHNGDPSTGSLSDIASMQGDMVVEWAPITWQPNHADSPPTSWALAVSGGWTNLLGGTIGSVWGLNPSGVGRRAAIANPPSVGQAIAIRLRLTTTEDWYDIRFNRQIDTAARLMIPCKPAPPPWCVPTASGAAVGYRP